MDAGNSKLTALEGSFNSDLNKISCHYFHWKYIVDLALCQFNQKFTDSFAHQGKVLFAFFMIGRGRTADGAMIVKLREVTTGADSSPFAGPEI